MISLPKSASDLQEGQTYSLALDSGRKVPVRFSRAPLSEAREAILLRNPDKLEQLQRLEDFPHVRALLEESCLDAAHQRRAEVREWLAAGIYVFGAYKVGVKLAREASRANIELKGFLDNDPSKQGSTLNGILVQSPSAISLEGAVVVIASGRHGNAISRQLQSIAGLRLINMHEFLYVLDAPHGPVESFAEFVEAPAREPFRFISTFLCLDDERSREVFDTLIGMRIGLSISLADKTKSPYDEEYFDHDFVTLAQSARFVDAGAFTGDTLRRLEARLGKVERAYLFEPELPAYYEALQTFAERPEVWLFNMGLDAVPSRAMYKPILSCNMTNEIDGPIAPDAASYIQGIPLDALATESVGLFKLDIEGMEERALYGAKAVIRRDRPILAVCAYHRADDYWRLMDAVQDIRSDYRVAIRLYADILEDITLYFY